MRYRLLGRTGLRVSEVCLGTMTFGEGWGWGASKDESRRIVDAFRDAGGNFIDTADRYTDGASERYVGELIGPTRDRWVLATKYSLSRDQDDPNGGGNHRKSLRHALDASLRRLGTDYVDLLWLHVWDFLTPIEEIMRALDDEVRKGKVLHVGVSNAPAWAVARANTLAELRDWSPFAGYQAEYSLIQRTPEREVLPMARALDLAVVAWSPLGAGVLTGKYNDGASADGRLAGDGAGNDRFLHERALRTAAVVGEVAAEIGASAAQVALAWVASRPGVVIPVIGARTIEQATDNLGSVGLELDDAVLARLDEASAIDLGYPHDFHAFALPSPFTFGHAYAATDSAREAGRIVEI